MTTRSRQDGRRRPASPASRRVQAQATAAPASQLPMESLVGKLSQQTLASQDDDHAARPAADGVESEEHGAADEFGDGVRGPAHRHAGDAAARPTPPGVSTSAAELELEADEGYCEGADDMAWLAGAVAVEGLPRIARSSGLLRFKTSTEAALQCSLVVRKHPRMRKRRRKKLETRLSHGDAPAAGPCPAGP